MDARNVLHVSAYDLHGGSARSAYRIHNGLLARGVTSRMMVGEKVTEDAPIRVIAGSSIVRAADWLYRKAENLTSLQYLMFPSSLLFLWDPWVREADVVQLYNIHGNYFAFTVLPALTAKKRVVWRLSDMWPLTGHCGYSHDCERWRTGCGRCPYLKEYPDIRWDTTALLYRIKSAVYGRSDITLVAPSRWMENLAKQSPLLSRFPVHYIPNGVDTEFFQPMDKKEARARLGVPVDRPAVILHDPGPGGERKGRGLLLELTERLEEKARPTVIVFGEGSKTWGLGANVHVLGEVEHERLRTAFGASDLFLFPSLSENLPNIVLESLACGTPVVTFPTGGVVDAVTHGVNGEIVLERTAGALAAAAEALLADPTRRAALSANARAVAVEKFSAAREIDRFQDLYRSLERP